MKICDCSSVQRRIARCSCIGVAVACAVLFVCALFPVHFESDARWSIQAFATIEATRGGALRQFVWFTNGSVANKPWYAAASHFLLNGLFEQRYPVEPDYRFRGLGGLNSLAPHPSPGLHPQNGAKGLQYYPLDTVEADRRAAIVDQWNLLEAHVVRSGGERQSDVPAHILTATSDQFGLPKDYTGPAIIDYRGWPLLMSRSVTVPTYDGAAYGVHLRRGIMIRTDHTSQSIADTLVRWQALPLGILWRNMFINLALYSAGAYFCVLVGAIGLSSWRQARGLCRSCGYSIQALNSNRCPECGGRLRVLRTV